MEKCSHPLNRRQAIAGGVGAFDCAPYGVVCLKCGEMIFSGIFSKSREIEPEILFAVSEESVK